MLAYIAYLLGRPGEEFHVLSLASKTGGTQVEADELVEPATEGQANYTVTVGRGQPVGFLVHAGRIFLDGPACALFQP